MEIYQEQLIMLLKIAHSFDEWLDKMEKEYSIPKMQLQGLIKDLLNN